MILNKIKLLLKYIISKLVVLLITKVLYPIFSSNLKVETLNINIDRVNDKQQQQPIKIVQLSDIHYDKLPLRISDPFLSKVVKATNDLMPDLILITGDLIEREPEPVIQLYKKHLSNLKSKYGIYCVLGNHDYKKGQSGADFIKNQLKDTNIKILENEIIYPIQGLQLIGIDTYAKRDSEYVNKMDKLYTEIKAKSNENLIKFVILHNPDNIVDFNNSNSNNFIDIAIAGHSHGSQICLPNGKPLLPYLEKFFKLIPIKFFQNIRYFKVIKNWKMGKGYYQIINNNNNHKLHFYVNRGLGTHPPLRLNCPPEITVININNHDDNDDFSTKSK